KVIQTEALELAAKEFLESILQNREPLTSGRDGLDVVKILEVSDLSLQNKGQLFDINSKVVV
ncbi:MAG: gfo/Idh/MocA family oxidoreductase, partial [Ignavibacteriaceae bacterium]|nr:gfo/Idh/MocA family oxidoreductase [Ignavibacteriaceae bacterium]